MMRWARVSASARSGQGLGQLVHGADADLVPVEEVLAQVLIGLLGQVAGGAFPADGVDELLQHRLLPGLIRAHSFAQNVEQMGDAFLFVGGCRSHDDSGALKENVKFPRIRGSSLYPSNGSSTAVPSANRAPLLFRGDFLGQRRAFAG